MAAELSDPKSVITPAKSAVNQRDLSGYKSGYNLDKPKKRQSTSPLEEAWRVLGWGIGQEPSWLKFPPACALPGTDMVAWMAWPRKEDQPVGSDRPHVKKNPSGSRTILVK